MGNFNRGSGKGGRFGGGGSGNRFGGKNSGRPNFPRKSWGGQNSGSGDRGLAVMHQAICDECKKSCEVPFRPMSGKPVYCSECFSNKKEQGGDRLSRREFIDRTLAKNNFMNDNGGGDVAKKQLELITIKLDQLIKSVEKIAQSQVGQTQSAPKITAKEVNVLKSKKIAKGKSSKK